MVLGPGYSAAEEPTGNTVMLYQKEMHEAVH